MAKTLAELEIERHILPSEVLLSDGTKGRAFTRSARNENNVFVYTCHICGVANLPGEIFLQRHIQGRKHQTKMELKVHDAIQFRALKTKLPKIPMEIAPGEPVPPGFENEVKPYAQLQATLDKFKLSPLVGLEYVMELIPDANEGGEPSYQCILCDKRGDPRTIMSHITSYNHRAKYLEKHFPGVIKEIGPIRFNKEACRRHIPQEMIERVCKSIEDYHGRLTPNVHPAKDYELNKMKYLQEAIFDKHFDERTGPKFLDAIDKKAIDLFYKEIEGKNEEKTDEPIIVENTRSGSVIELSDASSISSGSIGGRSRSRSPNRKRRPITGTKRRISLSPFSRKRRVSRSPKKSHKRNSPSPVARGNSSKPRVRLDHLGSMSEKTPFDIKKAALEAHTDTLAPYMNVKMSAKCKDEVTKAVELLKRIFKEYLKNPEKHPDYNDEWKKFWNRRFKELQKEGKDPSKYDFKPDWIEYWSKRMKEILDEDIERKVKEIQKKHRSKSPSPKRSSRSRRTSHRSRSRDRHRRRSRSSSLSSLESLEDVPRKTRSRSKSRSYAASDPYKDDFYTRHRPTAAPVYPGYDDPYASYYGYTAPPVAPYYSKSHHAPPKKVTEPEPEPVEEEKEEESNEPVTLVSTLRLVSALEDHLGHSLGPRVIDLLSKALALEKVKPNSSDEVLLSDEVCVLLETVKEKLKGILNAKLVRDSEEKAIKKSVKNIAELVHIFSTKNNKDGDAKNEPKKRDPKEENLATRIRSALIVQGKIDTPESVIDELIEIFFDMAQQYPKDRKTQFTVKSYLIKNKYIEGPSSTATAAPAEKSMSGESSLESLTDSDLKTLLQNFKDLSGDEQQHLITYLKKLEASDPERVKKLRSYVQMYEEEVEEEREIEPRHEFSKEKPLEKLAKEDPKDPRLAGIPISKPKTTDIFLSDDEDDYNYDDLVKSTKTFASDTIASDENTNTSTKDDTVSHDSNSILNKLCAPDTQNLIANLMGSLQQSINTVQQSQTSTQQTQPIPEKLVPQSVKSNSGYNQYVAKSTIQATRDQFGQNQAQKSQQTQQQQQPQQQGVSPFQAQGNGSLFPIQQQQNAFTMYQNQMSQFGQFQGQNQMQQDQDQQQRLRHTSYVRTNTAMNQGVSPWQIPPQQQMHQNQQQNNNMGSQPFYQWYQN